MRMGIAILIYHFYEICFYLGFIEGCSIEYTTGFTSATWDLFGINRRRKRRIMRELIRQGYYKSESVKRLYGIKEEK